MKRSHQTDSVPATVTPANELPKPSVVRAWLKDSSEPEPVLRAQRVEAILEKVRLAALPTDVRFRSIEICRQELASAGRDPDKSLAGLSLPLHPDKEKLFRKYAQSYWSLAACYMRVASDLASTRDAVHKDATYLLCSCYWGINSLAEHLLTNYEHYAKVRPGVWLDIHKFYNMAHSEGVQDMPLSADQPSQTVEHIYKRVLLLGLSDPYRHPFRSLAKIYGQLDDWAAFASLTTVSADPGRCVFIVDPALDRAATPALAHSRIRPAFNEKWLITREMVDRLKLQHERTAKKAASLEDKPESMAREMAREMEPLELLRRVIVSWGLHPVRNSSRTRTYRPCDVVIGLKSVCVALNQFRPLRAGLDGAEPSFLQVLKGAGGERTDGGSLEGIVRHWEIADESERGLRMTVGADPLAGGMSVGELISLRSGRSGEWRIGYVHWAQTDHDNKLSLGLRMLSAGAEPVLIGRLGADRPPDAARSPALLLVSDGADRRTLSLLCDKSVYLPMGTYLVHRPQARDERVMEATGVLLSTRSFVWFEACKPQARTSQRTLDLLYPY